MSNAKNPAVSIIVPVYNVEAFLDRCVESLVAQTLRDIEILLVDDGSTDSSPALCDAWQAKDARIRVVHKRNGGLSDARNVGVKLATADWIGFVDSDDYVSPEMYKTLVKNLIKTGADLSICGIYNVYSDRVEKPSRTDCRVFSAEEAAELCLHGNEISVTAVNRLYPACIFEQVTFPVGRTTEDGFTAIEFLSHVSKVVVDFRPQYYYEHREGTLSTRPYDQKSYDVVDAYEHNLELVKRRFPSAIKAAEFRCYWARFTVLDSMVVPDAIQDDERRNSIVGYLRHNFLEIMGNPYLAKLRKIALIALVINPNFYDKLSTMQRKRIANK